MGFASRRINAGPPTGGRAITRSETSVAPESIRGDLKQIEPHQRTWTRERTPRETISYVFSGRLLRDVRRPTETYNINMIDTIKWPSHEYH
jgi:hypothetical protein